MEKPRQALQSTHILCLDKKKQQNGVCVGYKKIKIYMENAYKPESK